jgi:hypothetical protein
MSIPLSVLDTVTIATPCTVPWDAMQGDERRWFCLKCSKHVHDISEMTAAEAIGLLDGIPGAEAAEKTENELPCIRLYRRPDGRVVTSDCPTTLRERIGMWLVRRSAWAASIFAMIFLSGCREDKPKMTQGVPCWWAEQAQEAVRMAQERLEIAPMPHVATRPKPILTTSPEASTEK